MAFDRVYFWTDTIKDWRHILVNEEYKKLIISSLAELVNRGTILVYGFVIMPNHLHLAWEMKEMNGKETPQASFNKYTSHIISSSLKTSQPEVAEKFRVDEPDRKIRIWRRDPLAVEMDTLSKMEQKLDYIHCNPLQAHWNLAVRPEDYVWSSAGFYETGRKDYSFLTDYRERF
ncbi:transposase [Algoriphagus sp. H41]|uniref:Transposase n=2 Tax=Algoriphagus oliviformis TaxID=2811231 RepID=A0ABS3C7K2_9BACT|nr:transposase [Algoriphagus oliviformis]